MKFNLIIPIAADKPEYRDSMPYLFDLGSDGIMLCVKSITGLNLDLFDNIYFTILKKHSEQYFLKEMFDIQFRRLGIKEKTHVVELNESTKNQPETIYQTIQEMQIVGSVMIKDADSFFTCKLLQQNSVCVFPLDAMQRVNPQDKSYVNIDEMYYITNIIERKIISKDFCSGGYIFEDAYYYAKKYIQLSTMNPLYLSHIIFSMLLDDNINFRPIQVKEYQDWGTPDDWINIKRKE